MNFRLKFSSSIMETAFMSAKAAYKKSFLKVLIPSALATIIFILFHTFQQISLITLVSMPASILISFLLWKNSCFKDQHLGIILALLSFAFMENQIFGLREIVIKDKDFFPLHIGYIFGVLEKILTQHLPRLELKILFLIASLVTRILAFSISTDSVIWYEFIWWLLSVFSEFWRERDDRAHFKKSFESQEKLIKFKELMVSGLPINVMILAKTFKKKLFTNECFQSTFQTKSDSSGHIWDLNEWLSRFYIEKEGLSGASKDALGDEGEIEPTMLEFANKLISKRLLDNHNLQFSFNVRSQENDDPTSKKTFMVKIFSLPWDGEDAVAVFLNDMTQQYQNLTLKVADVNKDKMIAMVSHELRTPLNGILGMVHLMEKQVTDSQILAYLTVCKNSGKLLLNLVNSILDLGQIRNKKFQLKVSKGNIHELLQEIYMLFEFQFRAKGLYLRMNVLSDLAPTIDTDPNRLKQIIINLIGNALKFTFEGGVDVFVGADQMKRGYVNFRISDTGIGIKEEDQKKLFKMYGRLDQPDINVNSEGVGLGLTISDHLARLLAGGEDEEGIKVESVYHKGTTFSFSVKADLSEDSAEYDVADTEGREHSLSDESQEAEVKYPNYHVNKLPSSPLLQSPSNSVHGHENGSFSPKIDFSRDSFLQPSFYNAHEDSIFLKKSEQNAQVLLVDDSPFNIMVAKQLINGLGYQVESALNGKIAIDIVKAHALKKSAFKLIFMDCQMPVMSGYETTKLLRILMMDREIPDTPIVALSANDSQEDKQKCIEVGMCDHLSKPLSEERLRHILQKFCK